jgi:TP901 family phage tail tape measure protein
MRGAAATIRMMLDTRQMSTGLQQINREMSSLSSSAAKFTGALGVGLSATAILADATRVVMDYSAANSRLAAVLGTTRDATKELQEQQKALGASTKFTAAQVADAQTELAKLGFTQKEIVDSTSGVLSLAAASNIELARAAEIAGGTLRGFGLRASESGRVVDVMAASFTKSALDAEKFAESMKYVAPVAAAAGIDVETTTALLGKLADSMISGSMAGTSLKNLLSELSNENSDLAKEVGFGVKNSQDLIKAFEILATKNIDLTKATELTDERSKAAFLTLVNNTEALKDLTVQFENADGSAKQLASTMQDNLSGDLTTMRSAWEGFILSLEDGVGVMGKLSRAFVQGGTSFISFATKMNAGEGWAKALGLDKSDDMLAKFSEQNKKATARLIRETDQLIKAQSQLGDAAMSVDDIFVLKMQDLDGQMAANPKQAKVLQARKDALADFFFDYLTKSDKIVQTEKTITEVTEAELKKQADARKKAFDLQVESANALAAALEGINIKRADPIDGAAILSGGDLRGLLSSKSEIDAFTNSLVSAQSQMVELMETMDEPIVYENFAKNLQNIAASKKMLADEMEKSQFIINNFGMELRNVLSQGMTDFENFGEALEGVLKRMIADLLAATVAAGALSFILNAIGLGGGTSFKSIFGQISGMGALVGGVPKLASGGIVNRPTLAMIGEGGASEAVIPLNKLQSMMGSSGVGYINGRDIVFSNERAGVFLKRVGR